MKKIVILLLGVLLISSFSIQVNATGNVYSYDFRSESIYSFDEYLAIEGKSDYIMEHVALVPEARTSGQSSEIDFTNATKVLKYTAQELLEMMVSDEIILSLQQHPTYYWIVPLVERTDGVDYAIGYLNMNNEWTATTVSTTEMGREQVAYIFDKDILSSDLSQNGLNSIISIYAVTAPELYSDLIFIETENDIRVIPYSSRPDFFGFENGKSYSTTELFEKVDTFMKESQSVDLLSGGGVSGAPYYSTLVVPACVGVVCLLGIIFAIKKKVR